MTRVHYVYLSGLHKLKFSLGGSLFEKPFGSSAFIALKLHSVIRPLDSCGNSNDYKLYSNLSHRRILYYH